MIFDFHSHNTIRPYHTADKAINKLPNQDHWNISERSSRSERRYKALVRFLSKQLAIDNQSHFRAYVDGDARTVCTALYPIEQGFTEVRNFLASVAENVFINEKKLIAAVIGISEEAVDTISATNYKYFISLVRETDNLILNQGLPNRYAPGRSYQVVHNFNQIENNLAEVKKISVLLTVEGAHSFISRGMIGDQVDLKAEALKPQSPVMDALLLQMQANINAYRTKYPLFSVTFAHHFYNLLCGHAPTLPEIAFDQGAKTYFNLGISEYGKKIIHFLLKREPRRVLIDTKHMSYRSRIDYHDIIKEINALGQDQIPIIQTHTGVSGRPSMRELAKKEPNHKMNPVSWEKDNGPDWPKGFRRKIQKTLETSPLNLFDDEVIEIIASNGLMGIMLDEKRILGKRLPAFTDKLSLVHGKVTMIIDPADMNLANYKGVKSQLAIYCYAIKRLEKEVEKATGNALARKKKELQEVRLLHAQVRNILRPTCCAIFLNQVLYLARVVNGPSIYRHICIGTDFDGVINSLDAYPDASYLTEFRDDLRRYWKRKIANGETDFDTLRFGIEVDTIIDNIFWGNAENFLKKYFTDQYLVGMA